MDFIAFFLYWNLAFVSPHLYEPPVAFLPDGITQDYSEPARRLHFDALPAPGYPLLADASEEKSFFDRILDFFRGGSEEEAPETEQSTEVETTEVEEETAAAETEEAAEVEATEEVTEVESVEAEESVETEAVAEVEATEMAAPAETEAVETEEPAEVEEAAEVEEETEAATEVEEAAEVEATEVEEATEVAAPAETEAVETEAGATEEPAEVEETTEAVEPEAVEPEAVEPETAEIEEPAEVEATAEEEPVEVVPYEDETAATSESSTPAAVEELESAAAIHPSVALISTAIAPEQAPAMPEAPIWKKVTAPKFQRGDAAVSPDALQLHLASLDVLNLEPILDPNSFQPEVGTWFHDDGSLTLRVLVGNTKERLSLIGDFNNWGEGVDLSSYTLQPDPENPIVHEITLPPGNYHLAQYRLLDNNGHQRLDMGARLFSTPTFNRRFYADRNTRDLNAVFWKSTPIPTEEVAERPDLRGQQVAIAETDIVSLTMGWTCNNPNSDFYGTTGAENIPQLYRFTEECGLPEKLADMGYNAVQFMPMDTHVDFYDPDVPEEFPIWRYSYQTLNYYGKHADFGSPDELKRMVNAFHKANVAVVLDAPYSHFALNGNNPPREFGPYGYSQYRRDDGRELYGGPWTEWGTKRFYYTPEIRKNLVDAALINVLDYGFDGLRIDNVNGVDYEPGGRELLRELSAAMMLYHPSTLMIGEGYFGDPYLNRSISIGGAGMHTTYSDRFYLWFTEELLKYKEEVDMWALDHMLSNDWARTLLYYPGNHDEFANMGNPFQSRGRYLVDAIDAGYHNRKIQSWSALTLFASSYYLDMLQLWTLQPGNLNFNSVVEWDRLSLDWVAPMEQFQADMKKFFIAEPAFAPYNVHRNMLHWVDDANKVVVFDRIDFTLGRHVYVAVNLGDRPIDDYTIYAEPADAKFAIAVDSDRTEYGGSDRNPELTQAAGHDLKFHLGSYGVVALWQADKLGGINVDRGPIQVEYPDIRDYGSPLGSFSSLGSFTYPRLGSMTYR